MYIAKIEGMRCTGCSSRLERALQATEGITSAAVDLDKAEARIEGSISPEQIRARVEEVGFAVTEIR